MNDWASAMLTTEKHLRQINKLLTDHPASAPFTPEQLNTLSEHLYQAIHSLTQVHAWIHDRR